MSIWNRLPMLNDTNVELRTTHYHRHRHTIALVTPRAKLIFMKEADYIKKLEKEIAELKQQLVQKENKPFDVNKPAVKVPLGMQQLFDDAQEIVRTYFSSFQTDPSQASVKVQDQRYLLIRASSLSVDFFKIIRNLYADKGEKEAFEIASTFLFDIAHAIGMEDAKAFHKKMEVTDPVAKLSAGPIHFAYTGWAFVDIDPSSNPTPDDSFFMKYKHPYSFEAQAWQEAGQEAINPVCIMNSGYSSGWCEESFGIALTAVELSCKACGDEHCSFIMAPPAKIQEYLEKAKAEQEFGHRYETNIPTFFERKEVAEEMKRAKQKAEDSDRAKSEFLANMSHEMRTPLNAINGYINLMQKDGLAQEYTEYMNAIEQSSKHLLNIVNDILDLSKIEAGQLMLQKEACYLPALLSNSYSTVRSILQSMGKAIEVNYHIDEQIEDYLLTDETRLYQILYNLLSNAAKFTQKGSISFGVELQGDNQLLFYVKDTGVGIAPEKQATVFDMFGQVDTSSTRAFGGTGLGLTITKKIVEMLGGTIQLESSLGQGANFFFTHPYQPVLPPKEKESPKEKITSNLKGSTILLVEDNLVNQKLIELLLHKNSFEVAIVGNGQEAVNFYNTPNQRQQIDLILMDVQMPVLDGLSATQQIRQIEKDQQLPAMPIIALTAQAMRGDMNKCLAAGCNDYLTKPIMLDLFLQKITAALVASEG